ncbi:MAG TPA: hypothetical protein VEK76_05505 [Candidatus Binatia bacterium]|nr:hypothetical protein [Candidatus Binatia bacterium]
MERQRRRRRNRLIRLALALAATVAASGFVGLGGMAAWQAYSDNPANQVGAASLGHTNQVSSTCTSVYSTTLLNQTGNTCGTIITVSGVSPDSTNPLASGTVKITSTGQMNSSFQATMLNAPVTSPSPAGNLCADLTLTLKDATTTYWNAAALNAIPATTSLKDSAGAATWPGTSAPPAGSNTFTLSVSGGSSFTADSQDQSNTCTFDVEFVQTNT